MITQPSDDQSSMNKYNLKLFLVRELKKTTNNHETLNESIRKSVSNLQYENEGSGGTRSSLVAVVANSPRSSRKRNFFCKKPEGAQT